MFYTFIQDLIPQTPRFKPVRARHRAGEMCCFACNYPHQTIPIHTKPHRRIPQIMSHHRRQLVLAERCQRRQFWSGQREVKKN